METTKTKKPLSAALHAVTDAFEALPDNQYSVSVGFEAVQALREYKPLILAAPDLLAALADCLPDLEHYASTHGPGPDRRLEAAKAAIARATS